MSAGQRPHKYLPIIVLATAYLVGWLSLFKPWIHGTDPTGYYSWLRSVVVDRDLDTANEYQVLGYEELVSPNPTTGRHQNPYAVGSAILWAPGFLIVHGVRLLAGLPANGYLPDYIFAVSMTSSLLGFAAIWLSYRLASRVTDSPIALAATLTIWLSTPLLFYMYAHPAMAVANDAFVVALFAYVWTCTRPHDHWQAWLWIGATIGLAALVRTQNGFLIIVPAIQAIRQPGRPIQRLLHLGILGLTAFLIFTPQMLVWWTVFDQWIMMNPYAPTGGGTFDARAPHMLDVLLSTDRGLFIWSPVTLLAILGLFWLWQRDRQLTKLLLAAWLAQLYVTGGWSAWAGGVSFGQRFMANNVVTYSLGLAALLKHARQRIAWPAIIASLTAFAVWNVSLLGQYIVELIPRAGPVDLGQMAINQIRVVGVISERLYDLLAARFR